MTAASSKKDAPAGAAASSKKGASAGARIKVQYYRSAIGFAANQKLIVKGLGFGKLQSIREVEDTPSVRGMVAKAPHLLRIVE
jgi:large subunit ribosomal protein L30